jgi:DNA invertase Pin-like site-specific DNA recombinase
MSVRVTRSSSGCLDRFGRSPPHLVETIVQLEKCGIGFRSLTEGIDISSAGGSLVLHVFAARAEFERAVVRERTLAGLEVTRGGGRLPAITPEQIAAVGAMRAQKHPMPEIVKAVGVSRATIYATSRSASAPSRGRRSGDRGDARRPCRAARRCV